jgi:hypothetical protein
LFGRRTLGEAATGRHNQNDCDPHQDSG